jgi:hypothetical protein
LRRVELTDVTSLIQLFGSQTVYTWFDVGMFLATKIKNFEDKGLLYEEWITIDTNQDSIQRTVMSIWDLFGYVGGI